MDNIASHIKQLLRKVISGRSAGTTSLKITFFVNSQNEDKFTRELSNEEIDVMSQCGKQVLCRGKYTHGFAIDMSTWRLCNVYKFALKNHLPVCFNLEKTLTANNVFDTLDSESMLAMVLIEMPDEDVPTDAVVEEKLHFEDWAG